MNDETSVPTTSFYLFSQRLLLNSSHSWFKENWIWFLSVLGAASSQQGRHRPARHVSGAPRVRVRVLVLVTSRRRAAGFTRTGDAENYKRTKFLRFVFKREQDGSPDEPKPDEGVESWGSRRRPPRGVVVFHVDCE